MTPTKTDNNVNLKRRFRTLRVGSPASPHARRAPIVSAVVLVLLAGLLLPSCSEAMWQRRSPDFQRVPPYPNARLEHVDPWQRCTREGCFGEERRMRFETDDSPALVLAYYDRTLPHDGWTKSESTTKLPAYLYHGCPFYVITVEVTRSTALLTTVEAILTREGCR